MNEYTIHIELEQNFYDLELETFEDYYPEDIEELDFEQ